MRGWSESKVRERERVQVLQGHHERERAGTPVDARARVYVHEGRSHGCREPQSHFLPLSSAPNHTANTRSQMFGT